MKFIETIKIKNTELININYHIKRANKTILDNYNTNFNFEKIIEKIEEQILSLDKNEIYKLRIIYGINDFEFSIEKYILKPVNSLKIVMSKDYFYRYKFFDRKELDQLFKKKENCDNIIITVNDNITDSYYSNLVFEKDKKYFTPNTYLLNGTKRNFYLDNKIIEEKEIKINNLKEYDFVHLINSMIDIGDIVIDVKNIY